MDATESMTVVASLTVVMGGLFAILRWGVGTALTSLRGEMVARFDGLDRRINDLDDDVQALTTKVFGQR